MSSLGLLIAIRGVKENAGGHGRNARGLEPQRSLTSCQEVES